MVGQTPLLWVLALVAAVLRLWARRRVLAALSVAVLALDRAWALTRLGLPRAGMPAATAPQQRLFSANLHYGNPNIGSIARRSGRRLSTPEERRW